MHTVNVVRNGTADGVDCRGGLQSAAIFTGGGKCELFLQKWIDLDESAVLIPKIC
jgi:hypothetical protein